MKKDNRNLYLETAGIFSSAMMLAVLFFGGVREWKAYAVAAAVLILVLIMIFVRDEKIKDFIGLAGFAGTGIGLALMFLSSPALPVLVWMCAMVFLAPLLLNRYPVVTALVLAAADGAVLIISAIGGITFVSEGTDIMAAVPAFIVCAAVSATQRRAQEHDTRKHARTIALLEDTNEELENEGMTDPLTGLFDKGYYEMMLPKMIASHHQYGLPLTAIFVDIDHFKNINDTYGHDMGDKALVALADALQKYFRKEEIIRFGGEEFLILLTVDAFTAFKRIDAAREYIENMVTEGISYTISSGVAEYKDDMSDHDLAKAADVQMYRAKTTGRNKVCM